MMTKLIIIFSLLAILILTVLFIMIYVKDKKIQRQQEELQKAEADIEQRRKYEQGVKEDNEKLNKVNSGNKLSNFNAGLDLLRDK